MNPCPLKPAATQTPSAPGSGPTSGLWSGDVVDARDEVRERHRLQPRQERLEPGADGRAASRGADGLGSPSPARSLARTRPSASCLAASPISLATTSGSSSRSRIGSLRNRKRRSAASGQPGRRRLAGAGRCRSRPRRPPARADGASLPRQEPSSRRRPARSRSTSAPRSSAPARPRRLGERLDRLLGPVEVPVLGTPGGARIEPDRARARPRPSPAGSRTRDGMPSSRCRRPFAASSARCCLGVGDERVPARAEARAQTRPEPIAELPVEGERLPREQAVDRRRPLLADTAGLDARGAGSDPGAVDDATSSPQLGEVAGDREPDHAGADHGDVGRARLVAATRATLASGRMAGLPAAALTGRARASAGDGHRPRPSRAMRSPRASARSGSFLRFLAPPAGRARPAPVRDHPRRLRARPSSSRATRR